MTSRSSASEQPAARPRRWRYAVPVMALVAGLLFGTSAALARSESVSLAEPADLAGLVQQRNVAVESLADQAAELATQVRALERSGGQEGSLVGASREVDALAPLVGMGPVRGPGLRVVLDDAGYSLDTLPRGYSVDDVVVHQQDVQAVVNALWAGGAEAMMIQDQRVVATSAVQCVGNTLYLQGRVYSPPYRIAAIGDTESMMESLEQDPVVQDYRGWSEALGLGYVVEPVEQLRMPGFGSVPRPDFASASDPR